MFLARHSFLLQNNSLPRPPFVKTLSTYSHSLTFIFRSFYFAACSAPERVAILLGLVRADYERACACVAEELAAHAVVHIADRSDADWDEVSVHVP